MGNGEWGIVLMAIVPFLILKTRFLAGKLALEVGWVERSGTQHLRRVPLRFTRPTKKWRRYSWKNLVS